MSQPPSFSRRDFLQLGTASAAGLALWSCTPPAPEKLDWLLHGGKVYLNGRFEKQDIGLRDGKIVQLAPTLSPENYSPQKSLDCKEKFIVPGWVDLHVHIGEIGLKVERLGASMGVTALVDAGTYGPKTFEKFLALRAKSKTPLFCWLNLRGDGITFQNVLSGPKNGPGVEDVDGARKLIQQHPDVIRGFKVRIDKTNTLEDNPLFLASATAKVAKEVDLPVVYHLGEPRPSLLEFLSLARKKDMITHFLRDDNNNIFDAGGKIRPEVLEAQQRGVRFDVGHGGFSFLFQSAERALQQDFRHFTISSDLWQIPANSGAYTLAHIMSKFLALGLPLEDIIHKTSVLPRQWLNLPQSLAKGQKIDLTLFSLATGDFSYTDPSGAKRPFPKRIIPEATLIQGQYNTAGDVDRQLFLKKG